MAAHTHKGVSREMGERKGRGFEFTDMKPPEGEALLPLG